MLYLTTRSNCDTFTAARTLTVDTSADGGMFVPFRMPYVDMKELKGLSQPAVISHILGLFFRSKLTEADVLFCLGGEPVSCHQFDRKITVARLWNNHRRSFDMIEYSLYCKLCQDVKPCRSTTQWPKIAIRIAVLGALTASAGEPVDIAVNAGDFLTPMAAYYCRQMGFPVGTILCVTNENSGLWDLMTHGELDPGATVLPTDLPLLDIALPEQLERLIFHISGLSGVQRYCQCIEQGRSYKFADVRTLCAGFSVPVVSTQRVPAVIHRVYSSAGFVLDTYAALTYGGLQDHRASCGDIRQTLLLSEFSPVEHRTAVSAALRIPEFKLTQLL